VAKAFATLDRLSGGRAILGVGAGHVEREFALLGLDFATRGRHVEAALPAIRAALDDEYPALPDGEWGLDGSAAVAPRPVQASLPIWVGGSSAVAVRRAARLGDGWLPQGIRPRDLPGVVERIRRLRAEAGRPERFDIGANVGCFVGTPTWDVGRTYIGEPAALADMLRPWVEAGANQLQVRFRSRDRAELVDQIERFGAEVAPNL
jgi:alkanesulfonate monooxygenase SsuD/methylene tetrahydromethanopterin reductase-like flavin-dependent oxidoreductase (luciferase family)